MAPRLPTVGVEEEFHVVDPDSGATVPAGQHVLDATESGDDGQFDAEIQLTMVETGSTVSGTLDELEDSLRDLRRRLVAGAGRVGRRVVAAGTVPLSDRRRQRIWPKARYDEIVALHQKVIRDAMVCGCHVHVAVPSRDAALEVLVRSRRWLPVLLALASSSPYWGDEDTGYASYRAIAWGRWPTAGMPRWFDTVAEHDGVIERLIASGTIVDDGQVYWDVRLSSTYDTIEYRVADACTRLEDAVVQAGLARALTTTLLREHADGTPRSRVRPELLDAAKWRAARFGVTGELNDPVGGGLVPAEEAVGALLTFVRDALDDAGDRERVEEGVARALAEGGCAERQRRWFECSDGSLAAVVERLADETARGVDGT